MFVNRVDELRELNMLLDVHRHGQLGMVYGRRRVGKTTLLLEWTKRADRPSIYWVGRSQSEAAVRQSITDAFWSFEYPDDDRPGAPTFRSWDDVFRYLAKLVDEQPAIVIFDEFPYAVESDPSLPSHLQVAWDHWLKELPITLILAGSHIGMMVDLVQSDAPLYGRFYAQLQIDPLPYASLYELFPTYSVVEGISTYAVLGGVPFYWESFDPDQSPSANIRRHLFRRAGFFRSEPRVLIGDLIHRETRHYEDVLRAIASEKAHTFTDIADAANVPRSNLSFYLKQLRDLHLVERQIPVTVPREQRRSSRRGRYYLRDPFLRFHYRFVDKYLDLIEQGRVNLLWERIREQFRAFVGGTTFEELCREWVLTCDEKLPFMPEIVGQHWSTTEQIDVCAINWRDEAVLFGECKWGTGNVGRKVVRDLVRKSTRAVPDGDFDVYYAFFVRDGFTDAAAAEAGKVDALLVTAAQLDADLRAASLSPSPP